MTAANPKTSPDEDEFITPSEIAQKLRVSRQTVYRWCHEGYLPAIRLGSGSANSSLRIRRSDYRSWLADQPAASA